MANDDLDLLEEDVDLVEGVEDNARALTSGLVIGTTIVLVLAFVVMQGALNQWFKVGLVAS